MSSSARYAALLVLLLASIARGAQTQTQYLSGLGKDDPVPWQILCDKGRNANKWSTIGVPSNWELQGFGIYTYGRVPPRLSGLAFTVSTSVPSLRLRVGATRRCSSILKVA